MEDPYQGLYALYEIGVRGTATFILAAANNMWFRELRDPTTFYTDILPSALLAHIEENGTGLHVIDAVDLPLIIQGYYADASSMTVNINTIKDAQRKLLSTALPLSDATLLATETKAVFASKDYPGDSREWERDTKDAKAWAA